MHFRHISAELVHVVVYENRVLKKSTPVIQKSGGYMLPYKVAHTGGGIYHGYRNGKLAVHFICQNI